MKRNQKNDLIFSLIIFITLFFFFISNSTTNEQEIICKDGIITLSVENKALETIVQEISNKCNFQIFLDQNARNVLINANFKGYPVQYAISKMLEGTELNFIIYQNKYSNVPWTIYIGPSKSPGEQPTYIQMGASQKNSPQSYQATNYYNQPQHPPTSYTSKPNPIQQNPSTPNYQVISVPTAGGYVNPQLQQSNNTTLNYDVHNPNVETKTTSPKINIPNRRPPIPDNVKHPRDNFPRKQEPSPQPSQTPPPNTGSG